MDKFTAFRVTIAPDYVSAFGEAPGKCIALRIHATSFIYEHEEGETPMVSFQIECHSETENEDGEVDVEYVTVASLPMRAVALIERIGMDSELDTYYSVSVERVDVIRKTFG